MICSKSLPPSLLEQACSMSPQAFSDSNFSQSNNASQSFLLARYITTQTTKLSFDLGGSDKYHISQTQANTQKPHQIQHLNDKAQQYED